jgi:hypothetical protein
VVAQATAVRDRRDQLAADLTGRIDGVRRRITETLVPRLQEVAGIAPDPGESEARSDG